MRESDSELVLIVAPFGHDAAVAAALLARVKIESRVYPHLQAACAHLSQGGAGKGERVYRPAAAGSREPPG